MFFTPNYPCIAFHRRHALLNLNSRHLLGLGARLAAVKLDNARAFLERMPQLFLHVGRKVCYQVVDHGGSNLRNNPGDGYV